MDSDSEGERGTLPSHLPAPTLQMLRELGSVKPRETPRSYSANPAFIQRLNLQRKLQGHSGCVNTVAFSPCGTRLYSGSDDHHIKLWDWERGTQLLSWDSGHHSNVFQARAFPNSDGSTIVSSAADGQIRVAGILQGASRHVFSRRIGRHEGRAHKIAFTEHPWTFLSCGEDGYVNYYDLRQPTPLIPLLTVVSFRQRPLELYSIAINPLNASEFCVGGQDEAVRVFDLRRPAAGPQQAVPLHFLAPRGLCSQERMFDPHLTCAVYSRRGEILASYNDEDIYLLSPDAIKTSPGDKPSRATAKIQGCGRNSDEDEEERNSKKGVRRFDPGQSSSGTSRQRSNNRRSSPEGGRRRSDRRHTQRRRRSIDDRSAEAPSNSSAAEARTRPSRRQNDIFEASDPQLIRSNALRWLYRRANRIRQPEMGRARDTTVTLQQFDTPDNLFGEGQACSSVDDSESGENGGGVPLGSFLHRLQASTHLHQAMLTYNWATGRFGNNNDDEANASSEEEDNLSIDSDEVADEVAAVLEMVREESDIEEESEMEETSEELEESDEEEDDQSEEERRTRWRGPMLVNGAAAILVNGVQSSMAQVSGGVLQVYKGEEILALILGLKGYQGILIYSECDAMNLCWKKHSNLLLFHPFLKSILASLIFFPFLFQATATSRPSKAFLSSVLTMNGSSAGATVGTSTSGLLLTEKL